MTKTTLLTPFLLTLIIFSCKSTPTNHTENTIPDTAHSSKNALDWAGNYKGTLPCADCEGILTTITLHNNDSFKIGYNYLGKDITTFTDQGMVIWNEDGNKITLKGNSEVSQYVVGENVLTKLDLNENKIEGELAEKYQLKKLISNPLVTDKYWKLIELNGKKITVKQQAKEAHVVLKTEENQITGNGGCNSFFGTYQLLPGDRIQISPLGSTKMACLNDNVEDEFLKILAIADNYTIKNDTLSLNKARMAPLAKFELVIK